MPKFGDLGSKFSKTIVMFKISIFEIGCMQNFVKIRQLLLFCPKCSNFDIWDRNLKNKSSYRIPDLPNFEILGCFVIFFGRFGWFRVLVSTIFIARLPLFLDEVNTCIAIVFRPFCNVISFEINLFFLIKRFSYLTKRSRQKVKYLEREELSRWNKKHF